MDPGADISVLPNTKRRSEVDKQFILHTACGSPITILETTTLKLNFSLRQECKWTFVIAAITHVVLGADFSDAFELSVDISKIKLVDGYTSLSSWCSSKSRLAGQVSVRKSA